MTTTDARGWINALIKAMHEETSGSWPDPEYKDEVYSALEMAVQALSQEPCDDAISRLDKIRQIIAIPNSVIQEDVMKYKMICEVMKDELPSVTQKSGKWITVTNGRGGHECSLCHEYAPSYKNGDEWLTNFCPNCGACMKDGRTLDEFIEDSKAESEE